MRRKFNLKVILTSIFAVSLLLLGTTSSKAVLQANPTTHASPKKETGKYWMTAIRQMETVGHTMGLTETLNGLDSTSGSNNLDIHMMLPTEHATIAILSASGYGNSGKLRDETDPLRRTTTGNSTGVYYHGQRNEALASSAGGGFGYSKYNFNSGSNGNLGSIGLMSSLKWHDGYYSFGTSYGATAGDYGWTIGYQGIFSWMGDSAQHHGYGGWMASTAYVARGICVVGNEV